MSTIVVWLLVSVSYGGPNYGTTTVVAHFASAAACERTRTELLGVANGLRAGCVRAEVVKP